MVHIFFIYTLKFSCCMFVFPNGNLYLLTTILPLSYFFLSGVDCLTKESFSHDCRVGDFVIWKWISQFTFLSFNLYFCLILKCFHLGGAILVKSPWYMCYQSGLESYFTFRVKLLIGICLVLCVGWLFLCGLFGVFLGLVLVLIL